MYPKEESPEARSVRIKRLQKKWMVLTTIIITVFASGSISVIGFEWEHLSTAFAVTSIISLVIITGGMMIASIAGEPE